ncbi:gasdermin-E-like [Echeneis naucrates]|uniref:Gasdermin-E-like n=1 Tax=Echeneis naucrates TaxID=173247 RepID=A0A665WJA8_ECHNA|nr:gasdermin-E-like [Echeneis naucrates]
MFSKATANFIQQVDPDGSLIHVPRINDSKQLVPMALIVKRKSSWFWAKTKYHPTVFTLSDLLVDKRQLLRPKLYETEFLTYEGTYGDKLSGKLETKAAYASIALEGQNVSKLQSSFGKLKKEELDVKELLNDSIERQVDMQHALVKQLEKRNDVLAIVKERIITSKSCTITQAKKGHCSFQGMFGLLDLLGSPGKICAESTNKVEMDSAVALEIPANTVIAYSILELEIKKNGQFDICLQPGTIGGFESDCLPSDSLNTVDCGKNGQEKILLTALQYETQEKELSPLADLSEPTRHALFKLLQEAMRDRTALSGLQCELDVFCSGETLDTDQDDMDGLIADSHIECSNSTSGADLNATHLLVSAMEELPDETLSLLCESPADFLEAFNMLMCRLRKSSGPLSIQRLPVPLQDTKVFHLAEQLLSSTNVVLKKSAESLWMETDDEGEVLFLLLCLTIQGLCLLWSGNK